MMESWGAGRTKSMEGQDFETNAPVVCSLILHLPDEFNGTNRKNGISSN